MSVLFFFRYVFGAVSGWVSVFFLSFRCFDLFSGFFVTFFGYIFGIRVFSEGCCVRVGSLFCGRGGVWIVERLDFGFFFFFDDSFSNYGFFSSGCVRNWGCFFRVIYLVGNSCFYFRTRFLGGKVSL